MPQIGAAFQGWQKPITVIKVTQEIVDGLVIDSEEEVTFQGTIQPLSAEDLALKPDVLRSWRWLMIHAFAGSLNLQSNSKIKWNGEKYKVMGIFDYSLNNFIYYHLIEDYAETE